VNDAATIEALTQILRDVIGDDHIVLEAGTRRSEVPGWDSFAYINFIVAVEMQFGVKFGIADVEAFADVGEIVAKLRALKG
jgi:acyl carrier protein